MLVGAGACRGYLFPDTVTSPDAEWLCFTSAVWWLPSWIVLQWNLSRPFSLSLSSKRDNQEASTLKIASLYQNIAILIRNNYCLKVDKNIYFCEWAVCLVGRMRQIRVVLLPPATVCRPSETLTVRAVGSCRVKHFHLQHCQRNQRRASGSVAFEVTHSQV